MSRVPRQEQDGSAEMPYEVGSSSSRASESSRTSASSGPSRSSSSLPSPTRALRSPSRIVPEGPKKTASIKKRAPVVVRPWTRQETLDYVQILKDNPHYQKALLRGHRKDASDVETTDKVSANTYLRNISAALGTGRTHDQMRNKKNWLYKKYDIAIASMEKTGVGLLLSEMKDGTIKNAREQLLIDFRILEHGDEWRKGRSWQEEGDWGACPLRTVHDRKKTTWPERRPGRFS
ncbi:hypothetical protein OC842_005383 [Tilletia horrida]|uniref:Uncharacterized protein n=1 Tax=Tilletia horrida TaxID=155126 RepID=A0AAN6JPE2_9BASI|nr:hypothetical protein OC842_005383 [Tilletia horrida]